MYEAAKVATKNYSTNDLHKVRELQLESGTVDGNTELLAEIRQLKEQVKSVRGINKDQMRCWNCGLVGHMKWQCQKAENGENQQRSGN